MENAIQNICSENEKQLEKVVREMQAKDAKIKQLVDLVSRFSQKQISSLNNSNHEINDDINVSGYFAPREHAIAIREENLRKRLVIVKKNEQEIEKERTKLKHIQIKLSNDEDKLSSQISTSKTEIKRMAEENTILEQKLNSFKTEESKLQVEKKELEAEKISYKKNKEKFEKAMKELGIKEGFDKLSKDNFSSLKKYLQNNEEKLKKWKEEQRSQKDLLNLKDTKIKTKLNLITNLESKLNELKSQNSKYTEKLKETESALKSSEQLISGLEKSKHKMEDIITTLTEQNKTLSFHNTALQNEAKSVLSQNGLFQNQIHTLEKENSQFRVKYAQIEGKLKTKKEQKTIMENHVSQVKQQMLEKETNLEQQNLKIQKLMVDKSDLFSQYKRKFDEIEMKDKTQSVAFNQKIQQLEKLNSEYLIQVDKYKQNERDLEKRVQEFELSNTQIRNEFEHICRKLKSEILLKDKFKASLNKVFQQKRREHIRVSSETRFDRKNKERMIKKKITTTNKIFICKRSIASEVVSSFHSYSTTKFKPKNKAFFLPGFDSKTAIKEESKINFGKSPFSPFQREKTLFRDTAQERRRLNFEEKKEDILNTSVEIVKYKKQFDFPSTNQLLAKKVESSISNLLETYNKQPKTDANMNKMIDLMMHSKTQNSILGKTLEDIIPIQKVLTEKHTKLQQQNILLQNKIHEFARKREEDHKRFVFVFVSNSINFLVY